MPNLKALAKDTAIYGLSTIVGRFLNYLLVPLYTHVIDPACGGYGTVTNVYAYTALLLVLLTFGMETTYFRFANKEEENPDAVFSTAFGTVTALSLLLLTLALCFLGPISGAMGYPDHAEYILMMVVVTALDAIQAVPFALLRFQKKGIKFAFLKTLFIVLNISLNLLCFCAMGMTDVVYVFILNLVCTGIITFFFIPELLRIHWHFDLQLLRRMFSYSWPILLLGLVGILNQSFDKMVYPLVVDDLEEGRRQLGIYGACVKIAMIMAMITMAFRFAYEPIVFASTREGGTDSEKKTYYAVATKFFLIFTLLAFLAVIAYMDILQLLIGEGYRAGLKVVPIVMAAEIMMGLYFNLSFWYKLIDKTIWGAWFSLAGCLVMVGINLWGIPQYGYMACAWAGFFGYATCMTLSYVVGQIKNPIPYDLAGMSFYVVLAVALFAAMTYLPIESVALRITVNTLLLLVYVGVMCLKDFPVKQLLRKLKK